MSKYKWIVVTCVVLLLAGGAAAAWRIAYPPVDPQVAAVQDLQKQLFQNALSDDAQSGKTSGNGNSSAAADSAGASSPPKSREQVEAERGELFAQLREQMENLTEEQRRQVMESGREMFRQRMRARIQEYHALPDDKKVAYLDEEIDRWEERRARFEQMRSERQAQNPPAGQGAGAGGNAGDAARDGRRGDRDGPRSDEDRQQWRRDMLADTTPQQRAEFAAYMDDMNKRREERGLQSFEPWRR